MTCPYCSTPSTPGSQFCPRCGSAITFVSATAPAAIYATEQRTRVGHNLQALGVLWCLFGAYRLFLGLLALTAFHTVVRDRMFGDVPPFVTQGFGAFLPLIAGTVIVMAGFSLVVGLSLLARKPWARPLAIVGGILALLKIPVGTALGIYTLWVLAPSAAGDEWQRIQQA